MLCTRAREAGGGSLMNFNFLPPPSRPTETVGPLPSALQRWVDTPQSGQVEGCGGQRQFHRHLRQPAPTEAPHPALLFQHPDHRLHDRFPSLVDRAPGGAAQFLPHPTILRVADRSASAHAWSPIQFACQRGVWHIGVDATLGQLDHSAQGEEAAVGADLRGPFPAALLDGFHRRPQRRVIGGGLRHPLLDDQMVLAHRDGDGVPQRETPPVAQKAAVRIRQRGACASGFAQLLQPAGDLLQPLLERRDVLGRQLLAGSFVRIVAVALPLPAPNLLTNPGALGAQRIDRLHPVRRGVRRRAAVVRIALLERAQLQRLDRPMQKETDVVFAQHVPHARRQQIDLLRVVVQKFRHRASSRRSIEDVSNRVFTQTLQACRKSGHFNISTAASAAEARSSRGFHTDSLTPKLRHKNSGAITSVIVLSSLMSTCNDGPAVSLNGSPTVSPTTAALCASERLPPNWPVSMDFLALSQAPPPLFISVASRMPLMVPTIKTAATDSAPIVASPVARNLKMTPTATGTPTASRPGTTMAFRAPTVTMSTHRP